ncbi:DUF2155 domain-containing protein [Komagataeibacter medellinensis]|uniref:DUF2155 domain-containing protein n=1 Tax=Komagataeibacter medellinensis (strain NBRC 3288 / BCRC 11682 / LMG 1693 / Kondo 51) TaxID=634177 RepID=G2I0Z0_KOMMN|nr:DUF2155 domain-containing protein [Komagataeibacter medellinensis]BAK84598.1 hypothetical protein GLX_21860 [Komagataeibacter medellinensis NBRC 3288]
MRRTVFPCLPALVLAVLPGAAAAADWLAPPAMYAPDMWQGRSIAVVRVLDKLDAHVQLVEIPVGQDVPYKSLTLHAASCLQRPATLAADSVAWLEVHDAHEGMAAFQGWMAIAEPATGVFQNPLYDVQLASCAGDMVAPIPPPLAASQAPSAAQAASPMPDGTVAPAAGTPDTPPPVAPVARPLSPPLPANPADEGAAPLMLH